VGQGTETKKVRERKKDMKILAQHYGTRECRRRQRERWRREEERGPHTRDGDV